MTDARFEAWLNDRPLGAAVDATDLTGIGGDAVRALRFPCPLDAINNGVNRLRIRQIDQLAEQQVVWTEMRIEPRDRHQAKEDHSSALPP